MCPSFLFSSKAALVVAIIDQEQNAFSLLALQRDDHMTIQSIINVVFHLFS